jgi:hypothetical protein
VKITDACDGTENFKTLRVLMMMMMMVVVDGKKMSFGRKN